MDYADRGYIALNTKTSKVVACNADMCIFSASTIKAPYIAALCKDDAPDIGSWESWMYDIMTTTTRPNDDVRSLRDALARAVS